MLCTEDLLKPADLPPMPCELSVSAVWNFPAQALDSPAWDARTRYIQDGGIEIDNNAAERSLRGVALVRKNYLFAGSAR